jgi:peptide/nickel transport system permease protein
MKQLSFVSWLGIGFLVVHVVMALAAPWIAPYSPTAIDATQAMRPPSLQHWGGTDRYGRDIFSRVIYGGQIALVISLTSAAIAVVCGGLIGVYVAYSGGFIDDVIMRLIDALISIPSVLLLLVIVTAFGSGNGVIIAAMVVSYLPGVVRVVRATALEYVSRDFIQAARIRGEKTIHIVRDELWPNILDVVFVEFAMNASWIVLAVSGLSFLGFGVNPPTPDWGLMVNENRAMLLLAPWGILYPMGAVATLVIALNLVSDAIAKALGLDRSRGVPV